MEETRPHDPREDRIAGLSRLPLERKAALVSGRSFWETEAIEEIGLPPVVLADGTYGLRHQSGQHDHLAMFESDPATCFPPGVAVGSSWDPELAARLGHAIGREARAQGVDIVLGPGINIKRSPLCGRNFEYYSEDPLLAGVLGASFTRGLQAEGPGVSVKHFAANNQETNRQTISADVDERTLREIYLPAFERVVTEASPATVMSAYNKINGIPSAENRWLLTDLLREEWGFTGAVVSDWNAITDRVAALAAGLDLDMPGGSGAFDDDIVAAVRSGALREEDLDASVARIARLARYRSTAPVSTAPVDVDYARHHVIARELAAECAVLLRNEGDVLPLGPGLRVAVIGQFAEEPRYQGGGSAHVHPTRIDTPLEEIRDLAMQDGVSVAYARGFRTDVAGDDALASSAVEEARRSDVAIVFAGLDERAESEGIDRADMDLPRDQVELILAVVEAAPRTVVVLANGGVVSLEGWHDAVDGILEGFLLGQGGGHALAEILFGRVNPSGHLAETIPFRLDDHPSSLNFPGEQGSVRYGEGVMVGYRYFPTFGRAVRYPFGHGLSYTTFSTGEPRIEVVGADSVLVRVDVANTGARAGKHVVQVYVGTDAGPVRRPSRELRAFDKVHLQPGETRTVELELPRRAFAYWDVLRGGWIVSPGEYRIQVAADAETVLHEVAVELAGDVAETELTMDTAMGVWFEHPRLGARVIEVLGLTDDAVSPEHMAMMASMTMRQFGAISGMELPQDALDEIMAASRPT
ncbi:beta-glucosidase [Clavibacter sepedonicus]|uniref:beta-glucosidase n=1 Tax=Clavibacter sepedonicus TaxID=31964 RepID=UPI003DA53315